MPHDDDQSSAAGYEVFTTNDYDIEKLISLKQTAPEELPSINPVLRVLIEGVCNETSPLSAFLGAPHLLQMIWTIVYESWKEMIIQSKGFSIINTNWKDITFPPPQGVNINMMPFFMERSFKKCKLPHYIEPYWSQIFGKHKVISEEEVGNIGYLTIHEGCVVENDTQGITGIHTDCSGEVVLGENECGDIIYLGRVSEDNEDKMIYNIENRNGGGFMKTRTYASLRSCDHRRRMVQVPVLFGGIYMASNVSDYCEVWDCQVLPDNNGKEIIGNLGDIEHLREFLPNSKRMSKNRIYWITDRTPHKSVPLEKGTYRQYFQLVTSQVSVWFEEHYTKNPLGVVPNYEKTKVVKGSMFENNLALLGLKPKDDQRRR